MKHAYLIIAHGEPYILEKLLKSIDDERNDIYIHIDKKWKDFDFNYFKKIVEKSNLYFTKRLDVRWGTYKLIECELLLFKAARKNDRYAYYHLLSGVDMPLKNQSIIHEYFDKNQGKEFICYDHHDNVQQETVDRIKYYHLFTSKFKNKGFLARVWNSLHYRLISLQKKLRVDRCKDLHVQKGAQWVSITSDLVDYIIFKEKQIKKIFKYSYCADEVFIQTMVYNSNFYDMVESRKDDDYHYIKRLIDWKRGEPYTFKKEDYNELINSDCFFARKFSTKVSKEVVDMLYNYVKGEKNGKI